MKTKMKNKLDLASIFIVIVLSILTFYLTYIGDLTNALLVLIIISLQTKDDKNTIEIEFGGCEKNENK